MIDSLSILLSTLACLFVVYRAVELDRVLPWFGKRLVQPAAIQEEQQGWVPPWA